MIKALIDKIQEPVVYRQCCYCWSWQDYKADKYKDEWKAPYEDKDKEKANEVKKNASHGICPSCVEKRNLK